MSGKPGSGQFAHRYKMETRRAAEGRGANRTRRQASERVARVPVGDRPPGRTPQPVPVTGPVSGGKGATARENDDS